MRRTLFILFASLAAFAVVGILGTLFADVSLNAGTWIVLLERHGAVVAHLSIAAPFELDVMAPVAPVSICRYFVGDAIEVGDVWYVQVPWGWPLTVGLVGAWLTRARRWPAAFPVGTIAAPCRHNKYLVERTGNAVTAMRREMQSE